MSRKSAKKSRNSRRNVHDSNASATKQDDVFHRRTRLGHIGAPTFVNGGTLTPDALLAASDVNRNQVQDHTSSQAQDCSPDAESSVLNTLPAEVMVSKLPTVQYTEEQSKAIDSFEDEIVFKGKDIKARIAALADTDDSDWLMSRKVNHEELGSRQDVPSSVVAASNNDRGSDDLCSEMASSMVVTSAITAQTAVHISPSKQRPSAAERGAESCDWQVNGCIQDATVGGSASLCNEKRSQSLDAKTHATQPSKTSQANVSSADFEDDAWTTSTDGTNEAAREDNDINKQVIESWKDKASNDELGTDEDEALIEDYLRNTFENSDDLDVSELVKFAQRDIDFGDVLPHMPSSRHGKESHKQASKVRKLPKRTSGNWGTGREEKPGGVWNVQLDGPPHEHFDVMDFERASLQVAPRRRKKDLSGCPQISDEELQQKLNDAWTNDRDKKRERKNQRENLRQQGLLPKHGSVPRSSGYNWSDDNDEVVDLKTKYAYGLSKQQLWHEISNFCDSTRSVLSLPPLDAHTRKLIHMISAQLNVKSKSHGKNNDRHLVLTKPNRRCGYDQAVYVRLQRFIRKSWFPRTDIGPGNANAAGQRSRAIRADNSASVRAGDRIGEGAPVLVEAKGSAKAKAMMEKMGWSAGQGLGSEENKGILDPIQQTVWYSKAGLG